MRAPSTSVLILYTNPLLGQGIARILAAEPGLTISAIPAQCAAAAQHALAERPDVVIVERSVPVEAMDLLNVAPDALLVSVGMDGGPSWTLQRENLTGRPEALVEAIRGIRRPAAPGRSLPTG